MPVYKRGPEKYEVRLWTGGRPKGWIVRGTRRDAEKFEARKRLELEAAGPSEYRVAPRFSEFCEEVYRVSAELRLASTTWRNRQYQIATLIEFFGAKPIDRITAADVERYQMQRQQAGVSAVTSNDDLKVLRAILGYAKKKGIPVTVPMIDRLPERATTGRVKVWTADEVARLYRALQLHAPHLLPITVVMLNAGLRKGEALALEWSCVDLERGLLLIYPNAEWRPKNGKPREVPIGAAVLPFLTGPRVSERWVFPRVRRRRGAWERYAEWPKIQWTQARRAAGIGGSPHTCRHTYASHFLAVQPDLFLLAKVLGHSHTRVTSIYAHLLPDHLERARNAVNFPAPLALVSTPVSGHGPDTVSDRRGRKTPR